MQTMVAKFCLSVRTAINELLFLIWFRTEISVITFWQWPQPVIYRKFNVFNLLDVKVTVFLYRGNFMSSHFIFSFTRRRHNTLSDVTYWKRQFKSKLEVLKTVFLESFELKIYSVKNHKFWNFKISSGQSNKLSWNKTIKSVWVWKR